MILTKGNLNKLLTDMRTRDVPEKQRSAILNTLEQSREQSVNRQAGHHRTDQKVTPLRCQTGFGSPKMTHLSPNKIRPVQRSGPQK